MLIEISREATRQDRSLSWIVQQAWKLSRADIKRMPSVNDVLSAPRRSEP
ncbi:MAG: TIGR04563 family protein [Deltaproteobacteria bacterium]|nr:TIGR04563 family protein [Deltaproteobacteria bacterium]